MIVPALESEDAFLGISPQRWGSDTPGAFPCSLVAALPHSVIRRRRPSSQPSLPRGEGASNATPSRALSSRRFRAAAGPNGCSTAQLLHFLLSAAKPPLAAAESDRSDRSDRSDGSGAKVAAGQSGGRLGERTDPMRIQHSLLATSHQPLATSHSAAGGLSTRRR